MPQPGRRPHPKYLRRRQVISRITPDNLPVGYTFARGGVPASYVDSAGVVRFTSGIRTGHYISGTRYLFLEGARTNGWTHSEDFSNAAWSKGGVSSVSANATTAPDAAVTADKIIEDSSIAATHYVGRNTPAIADNTNQPTVIHAKGGERSWLAVVTVSKAASVSTSYFNISTGSTGTVSGNHAVRIITLANGWFRIEVIWNSGAGGTTPSVQFRLADGNGGDLYTGDGTSGAYLWGAGFDANQLFPASYVPTGAATVTRDADSFYIPYTTAPKALTLYAKGVELGSSQLATSVVMCVGGSSVANLLLQSSSINLRYRLRNNSGAVADSEIAQNVALGDTIELRGVLNLDASFQGGISVNGAAEVLGALVSPGGTIQSPWFEERLYINSLYVGVAVGFGAYSKLSVLSGVRSMDTCRNI